MVEHWSRNPKDAGSIPSRKSLELRFSASGPGLGLIMNNVNAKYYYSYTQPAGLGVAFFATGPCLGLIMYILTTLGFPTHNFDFHLLTTSVNAIYYYLYIYIFFLIFLFKHNWSPSTVIGQHQM